ncbi:MAG: YbfB/YjiJ family MFS transporter, partial [Methylobacterium sp.]|nr:YbfB/YjiJ family MFS transporter [Methylobacterium sp.]
AKMMGKMTLAYGVAQIAGPAVTGRLAALNGSYVGGLHLAAATMLAAALLLLCLKRIERPG